MDFYIFLIRTPSQTLCQILSRFESHLMRSASVLHRSCTGLERRNLLLQSLLHGILVNAISRQLVRVRPTQQIMVNVLGWVGFRGDRALEAAGGLP